MLTYNAIVYMTIGLAIIGVLMLLFSPAPRRSETSQESPAGAQTLKTSLAEGKSP